MGLDPTLSTLKLFEVLLFLSHTVYVALPGRKCVDLVCLSTITQITVYTFSVLGSSTMKSIAILSYFHSGTLRDCNNPTILCLGAFTSWHTRHLLTNSAISFFMFRYLKCCFKTWYILVPHRCIKQGELWALVSISFLSSSTARMHNPPWHNKLPSNGLEKLPTKPVVN